MEPGRYIPPQWKGLTTEEVNRLLEEEGPNSWEKERSFHSLRTIFDTIRQPMFLLLSAACLLYFLLDEPDQGVLMLVSMLLVTAISIYQEIKSTKALAQLKKFTQPLVNCIRDGVILPVSIETIVRGDILQLEEGDRIPADATILEAHDMSCDESILSGESLSVPKEGNHPASMIYQGCTVSSGSAYACVTATGSRTRLGRIGKLTAAQAPPVSPLQKQISRFVTAMSVFGGLAFLVVSGFDYWYTGNFSASLLQGLTLAMSAIPEEIPVAFASFLALGATRLTKMGIVVRTPIVLESLGAVTAICLDKTGTLTENRMSMKMVLPGIAGDISPENIGRLLWYARLASESEPFDQMETAIIEGFTTHTREHGLFFPAYETLTMIREYPLEGRPPMMTHVYRQSDQCFVAAKGGPERIIAACRLPAEEASLLLKRTAELAGQGFRMLAVASASCKEAFPERQDDFLWRFEGLLAFFDAPKGNLSLFVRSLEDAGIRMLILSGDYTGTVRHIADVAGIGRARPGTVLADRSRLESGMDREGAVSETVVTGDKIDGMSTQQLGDTVERISLYARMFPETKLKVINQLKLMGHTIAMTGDGVNDGPAIKASDIGIAMGKKGTETAREAADLIIGDDNLEKITSAIAEGRKIGVNLQKAIRYMMTIHIPILTTAALPMLFHWEYPAIFQPVHIIFLELIMGPTCSIFYEREAADKDIMLKPPRSKRRLLEKDQLVLTIVQGVIAAAGLLSLYRWFMDHAYSLTEVRAVVFITLVFDNLLLTFTNRSMQVPLWSTRQKKNPLALPLLLSSVFFLAFLIFFPYGRQLFGLCRLSPGRLAFCLLTALFSIGWIEIWKAWRSRRDDGTQAFS